VIFLVTISFGSSDDLRIILLDRLAATYLESKLRGASHHVTIPDHDNVRVGTLHAILTDVAEYLKDGSLSACERALRRISRSEPLFFAWIVEG
jgi:hypothetical protein